MKLQKSLLILILLFIFVKLSPAFSQKCEVTKDPISGEKLITANYRDRWVYMENKGDLTKLQIVYTYSGDVTLVCPKGSELVIKLENDEILKLVTAVVALPKRQLAQGVVYTNYTFETSLDKAALAKLAASVPMLIRLPDMQTGEKDITEKWSQGKKYFKAINTGAAFILAN